MSLNTDYQNKYYVYTHSNTQDGCVYIGTGSGSRAWAVGYYRFTNKSTGYGKRSPEHNDWMASQLEKGFLPNDWVEILEKGLSKEEALKLEKSLIIHHKPKFNKLHNPDHIVSSKLDEFIPWFKNLREMGYSYTLIAFLSGADGQASRENTKAMSIWRALNG